MTLEQLKVLFQNFVDSFTAERAAADQLAADSDALAQAQAAIITDGIAVSEAQDETNQAKLAIEAAFEALSPAPVKS